MTVILTRNLAFATGFDAGCHRMRKQNREVWSDEDYDAAVRKTNRLLLHVPVADGGLHGLSLSPKQLADLGLDFGREAA